MSSGEKLNLQPLLVEVQVFKRWDDVFCICSLYLSLFLRNSLTDMQAHGGSRSQTLTVCIQCNYFSAISHLSTDVNRLLSSTRLFR